MATNYRDIPELADYIKMVENEGKKGYKNNTEQTFWLFWCPENGIMYPGDCPFSG